MITKIPKENDFIALWKQDRKEWIPNFVEGKIYSTQTDDYLTPEVNKNGYLSVQVKTKDKTTHHLSVHRALWVMRYGVPLDPTLEVDHINCNPQDNRLKNLRLVSPSENRNYRPAKFAQAEAIRREYAAGEKVADLAERYAYSKSMIRSILRNESYDPKKYPGQERKEYLHITSPAAGKSFLEWNK